MIRAGVFIGVDQTGGLKRLPDAAAAAKRMHDWAVRQGIPDDTHAKLITDVCGKVRPDQIIDAIEALRQGPGVDQLILYFAGHGVNIRRDEKWLLSDAPATSSAAVDVAESVDFARYGDIRHVVIISDACRVAPEGIQAGSVGGVPVFPNLEPTGGQSKPVDVFYACSLGRVAAEVKDPAVAAGNYSALYTNVMLEALRGDRADVLEPGNPADGFRYVRPDGLKVYLEIELPRRLKSLGLLARINQEPDAIIVSRERWLARVQPPPRDGLGNGGGDDQVLSLDRSFYEDEVKAPWPYAVSNVGQLSEDLVRIAVRRPVVLSEGLDLVRTVPAPGASEFVETAERVAAPFGVQHIQTACGIKVRGARMVDAFATRANLDQITPDGLLLRVLGVGKPAASVVVTFEGTSRANLTFGAVVPCIPGFIAGLTFEDDELVDVAYEPSTNNWRWHEYQDSVREIRALRGLAASSAQHGRFRLDIEDAGQVARKMQHGKSIDPTMAVYAAYAYHDLQIVDRIEEMSLNLHSDLGVSLFDVDLLALKLGRTPPSRWNRVVPFVPLLSQGWSLLKARRILLPPALIGIEATMLDSLWSLFDPSGVMRLRNALQTGEVR